jgi:hypothetical protein
LFTLFLWGILSERLLKWVIIFLLLARIIFGIHSGARFAAGRPAAEVGGGNFTGGTAAGSVNASQAASGDILVLMTVTKQIASTMPSSALRLTGYLQKMAL